MTAQYTKTAPAKGCSRRPYGLAQHRAWCYEQSNPDELETTDEWFRQHPDAKVRVVATTGSGGRWWNLRFIPRRGRPCELLGAQIRDILAERFPTGTPRERLLAVADWFQTNGVFAGRAA